MHINKEQRRLLADKFLDLGNLMTAGLVVGQLFSFEKYADLFAIGAGPYIVLAGVGMFLTRGR